MENTNSNEANEVNEAVPTPTPTPKICIRCRHVATNASRNVDTYKCFAPQNVVGVNLVDGSKIHKVEFCASHRLTNSADTCGIAGNWYEPIPVAAPVIPTNQINRPAVKVKVSSNLLSDLGM